MRYLCSYTSSLIIGFPNLPGLRANSMKSVISVLALNLLFSLSSVSIAQKTKRGTVHSRPPTTITPQPSPLVTPPPAKPVTAKPLMAPTSLVVVNGQTLTTADFQPALRQELESVEDKIGEARRSILDLQINTTLLQLEAKRRGITSSRLYEMEVARRIPVPTPAQIKKFIDENRAQFEGIDPAAATPQVEAYLHDEFESRLADDLMRRLRRTIPVVMGLDVNTPNLSAEAVVATIGGQPLKAGFLSERLKPIAYKMRLDAYEIEKRQADQLVDDLLLLAEANRRQIGPEEIIRTEISEKVRTPTEAEVVKFYSENKARISGELNTVRNQLTSYLQGEEKQRLEKELSDRLRKNADIRWLITEPPQPVQLISVDDDPAQGDANAPVTIVEFTDFQCPACAAMQPVLEEVLRSSGNKVRFVVRDFPLAQHQNARKAAEAANAANAQGKFFEYISLLFKRQNTLDVPSLKKYAAELGLNQARFDAALDGGAYAAEVKHDIEDGEIYGISSTPTIFVNGVMLRTLSAEALREAIDRVAASKTSVAPR